MRRWIALEAITVKCPNFGRSGHSKSSCANSVVREVKLNFSFVAKNYFYFFPERCSHEK